MIFEISKTIEILLQTPKTIGSILGNLTDDWIYARDGDDGWCVFDVVGHLIHGEETDWIPRAEIILAQGGSVTFEPFDRFAQFEKSKGRTLPELLTTFSGLRQINLETLKSWKLSEKHLRLEGIHPELGQVTLGQLLATWAVHDLTHIRQIVTILAKQYKDNVGVWKEYLSILH